MVEQGGGLLEQPERATVEHFKLAAIAIAGKERLGVRGWNALTRNFVRALLTGDRPLVQFAEYPAPEDMRYGVEDQVTGLDVRTLAALVDDIKPTIAGKTERAAKDILKYSMPNYAGLDVLHVWERVVQDLLPNDETTM
ncbi:MAG TPA: hypothetical protein VLE73_02370 [Candidatus Saccharimonadales bacterium]|nr:hypothetical protein [Candidatus Saccharimonadales bacterium]